MTGYIRRVQPASGGGGGGALTLERGMGMCCGHDSLFSGQSPFLAHQFTLNAPLLCPLFSIFSKFLHFQPCFGQNSSSLDPKFSFSRPPFFQEYLLPRPYIFKPAWHTPTKKKVECPPPGQPALLAVLPENKKGREKRKEKKKIPK